MKSMYGNDERPNDKYFFDDGILTIVCEDGVGKIILNPEFDKPISLEDIAQRYQNIEYVIHDNTFRGEVFSYNRYGDKEWWLVGKTRGHA